MTTMLKPNIQLFAEPGAEPEKEPQGAAPEGNGLPKSQEELDALISKRLEREKNKWAKQKTPTLTTPPPAPGQPETPPADPQTHVDSGAEEARRELTQARAELSAYKEGIKPEAVEDAVILAIRAVEKSGEDPDEDSIREALKEVIKRHPEWKPEDQKKPPIKVGANGGNTQPPADDGLSAIFGNEK